MSKKTTQHGFTLLLALLIISILLSLSLGITEIILKENQLSDYARESQAAFNAADQVMDCALFYHVAYDRTIKRTGVAPGFGFSPTPLAFSPFATSTAYVLGSTWTNLDMNAVQCFGIILNGIWTVTHTPTEATTQFTIHLDGATTPPHDLTYACADVSIRNYNNGDDSTIVVSGYNNCIPGSPKRVMRQIQVDTSIGP